MVTAGHGENVPHAVLHPGGNPDAYDPGVLRESWDDLDDVTRLVVVLHGIPFMDSAGLGEILRGVRTFREKGGDAIVLCEQPALGRLLATTGLDRIVGPLAESYEAALQMFRDGE